MLRLLTLLLLALLPIRGAAEEMLLSTYGARGHFQVQAFVRPFRDALEEALPGSFNISHLPKEMTVGKWDAVEALQSGEIDISLVQPEVFAEIAPDAAILASPLYRASMGWSKDNLVPGTPLYDHVEAELDEAGLVLLALFDAGPPVLATQFPVAGPDGLDGRTIRVYSKPMRLLFETFGTTAKARSMSDTLPGLKDGSFQGTLGGFQGALGGGHLEETTHLTHTNGIFGTFVRGYVMAKSRYETLPGEAQEAIRHAAAIARMEAQLAAISRYGDLRDEATATGTIQSDIAPGSEVWNAFLTAMGPRIESEAEPYSETVIALLP